MKTTLAALLAALILGQTLAAQQSAKGDDELFGGESVVTDVAEGGRDQSAGLLGRRSGPATEGADIGGTFRFEAKSSWTYDGIAGPLGADLVDEPLEIDLGAKVFLDARPSETLRVFGKLNLSYPFTDQGATRSFDEVFHVTELFSDFQLRDAVFFRAGKQTIHWGVGWFFSPADLLNITEIDPEDPEAEREGPVALKIQAPIGAHNLYLYLLLEDAADVYSVALAPKAELVVGNTELGLGGYYRGGDAPAAMATLTTALGDFDLFAEAVLSYGSDRTFVVEEAAAPSGVGTRTYDDVLYPSATAGMRYRYADDRSWLDVTVSAQYLYNGQGYEDPDLLASRRAGVSALIAAGELSKSDLARRGRAYGALNATWTGMFGSDFTLSSLWLANLADGSGMVSPSIRWDLNDELKLSLKVSLMYGDAGDEYSPGGEAAAVSLTASLGSGSF